LIWISKRHFASGKLILFTHVNSLWFKIPPLIGYRLRRVLYCYVLSWHSADRVF